VKLGFMSFFVKAVVEALKEFPAVNAEIDGDEIVYKNYYDIGVAGRHRRAWWCRWCATPTSSVRRDREGIGRLGKKARDGKLTMEDCRAAPSPSPTAASSAR
jgi:2-oxoglutarate dehydrogenase E2 component (dihydrolipoamide succinyltransferase)